MDDKKEKKKEPKELLKITITSYDDNQVFVTGPIDNPMLFFDLMNKAERIILNRGFAKMMEQMDKRIVHPPAGIDPKRLHS